jgi:NTE family protein
VNLALQGGGSHGAFTWGVLDRMLEAPWLEIEGISGTSAGAMNAAVLLSGLAQGGPARARADLERFWKAVSDAARFSPFQRMPIDWLLGRWTLDHSPIFLAMEMMARVVSPYDLKLGGGNPLADILRETVDFDAIAKSATKLFVTATHVRTGRGRIFRNADISIDALLASGCLPTLFQAVEIEGELYWDGGYSGNPTITPLIRESRSRDTILVQINPIERDERPESARDIANRLNEVSFNAVLMKELRMMALLQRGARIVAIEDEECRRWSEMRMHRISSPMMNVLGYSSKLNAEWAFITLLRDEGRKVCDAFLSDAGEKIGRSASFDIGEFIEETH